VFYVRHGLETLDIYPDLLSSRYRTQNHAV
jgi:hypothetical protein